MKQQLRLGAGLLLVGATAACTTTAPLPDEVSARVYQTRSDVAADAIEIQVHNGADTAMTVTSARLSSPFLRDPAVYDRATQIPAGATIDLKTPLPAASCDIDPAPATDGSSAAAVDLSFEIDGHFGHATLAAQDSLEQLPAIAAAACLQERVERVIAIRQPATVTATRRGLSLTYRVTPTGEPGSVRFTTTGPTTLLAPATETGRQVSAGRIGVSMSSASASRDMVVRYVPARCDAHAIAEDKQGTLLPIGVVAGEDSGSITLPVDAALRSRIQRTVARICGLS